MKLKNSAGRPFWCPACEHPQTEDIKQESHQESQTNEHRNGDVLGLYETWDTAGGIRDGGELCTVHL